MRSRALAFQTKKTLCRCNLYFVENILVLPFALGWDMYRLNIKYLRWNSSFDSTLSVDSTLVKPPSNFTCKRSEWGVEQLRDSRQFTLNGVPCPSSRQNLCQTGAFPFDEWEITRQLLPAKLNTEYGSWCLDDMSFFQRFVTLVFASKEKCDATPS